MAGAAGRRRRARALRPRPGRRLLRRGDPGRAGAGGVPGAVPRARHPGQRVVGVLRPGGEPVLRTAAEPPSDDFIMRNAMDAQEVAVGWWPGDARYGRAAFYAYAHPAPPGFDRLTCPRPRGAGIRAGRVRPGLGRRQDRRGPARHGAGVRPFGLPARLCRLRVGQGLAASAEGTPPPVRLYPDPAARSILPTRRH